MVPHQCLAFFPISSFLIFFTVIREASAIGCFVCSSVNGSEPLCEDTFSNAGSSSFYKQNCLAGRKGRTGWFPATACVKLKAELADKSYSLVVRQCVTDNGDINEETEIARSNHCGLVNMLVYEGKVMHGCVVSCRRDACNEVMRHLASRSLTFVAVSLAIGSFVQRIL